MNNEMIEISDCFVKALNPVRIYLFGSFAYGIPNENSDYDFYIVVSDEYTSRQVTDLYDIAYAALPSGRSRPVDILISTKSDFEKKKDSWPMEFTVLRKGAVLYDTDNRNVA